MTETMYVVNALDADNSKRPDGTVVVQLRPLGDKALGLDSIRVKPDGIYGLARGDVVMVRMNRVVRRGHWEHEETAG